MNVSCIGIELEHFWGNEQIFVPKNAGRDH
jgi:hypothetical protein